MRGSLGRYIGNTGSSFLQFPSHHKGFLSHGQHTILQVKGKPLEHRIPMCRVMYEVVYIRFLLEKMHAAFSAKRVCQGLKIGHWKDSVPYMQLLASANHVPLVKPPSVLWGILTSIPPLFLARGVKCTKVKCSWVCHPRCRNGAEGINGEIWICGSERKWPRVSNEASHGIKVANRNFRRPRVTWSFTGQTSLTK